MDFIIRKSFLINLSVLFYFIIIGFLITGEWFSNECTSSTHGDLENHFFTSLIVSETVLKYGVLYPVSFEHTPLGYYWFSYSPVPFLMPLLFRLFFSPRFAFLIVYTLFYSLSGFLLFVFLRINKSKLFNSFLLSSLFIFSGFMNQQFTVHGSYHTIAIIPFFLMTLIFLQKFLLKSTKSNSFFLSVFSALTMLMHFSMLPILSLFFVILIVFKRNLKLFLLFFLSLLLVSFYYIPLIMHSLLLPSVSSNSNINYLNIASYILNLPSTGDEEGTASSDYYYGPFYLTTFIISLLVCYVKPFRNNLKFSFDKSVNLLLLILVFSMLFFALVWSLFGFFSKFLTFDRVLFFVEFSLALFTYYVFSHLNLNKTLIIFAVFILNLFGFNKFLIILLLSLCLFFGFSVIKSFSKKFVFDISLFSFIFIIPLLLPFVISNFSLDYPRIWCIYYPEHPELNVFNSSTKLFFTNLDIIPYFMGDVINNIGHTTLFKNIPLGDNKTELFNFLDRAGVDYVGYTFNNNTNGILFYYRNLSNYLFFGHLQVLPRIYSINFLNPISASVVLNSPVENVSLIIYYHPWWRAFNGTTEFKVTQDDWFLQVNGLSGYSGFNLVFDTFWFNLGNWVSILSFFVLILFIKKCF